MGCTDKHEDLAIQLSSNRLIASEVVQYIDRNNSITSNFFTR